ncbi:MAG: glycosyltransferase [Treponema sp.]|nr:glycosyltransferase [Treponema sp.]
MDKLVSIIVPVYGVEKFLEKLILSLIRQTYENLEIILVDDGSPDNCGAICDKYAEHDSRIKVIHKENAGVSEARNTGMDSATGDFIVFVDGDDWLESDAVDYYVRLITKTYSDMAISDKNFTTRSRMQTENDCFEIWASDKAAAEFLYPRISIGCWNKIFRTEFLRKNNIRFTMKISGEGMHFIVSAAQKANHVGVGHRKVYNYRLNNENSAVTKYRLDMGIYAQKSINAIKDELILQTPLLLDAVNWHIWKNYGYILFLIIATDSKKENLALYKDCRRNLLIRLPSVLVKSKVSAKTKIRMVLEASAPVLMARRRLRRERLALQNDVME